MRQSTPNSVIVAGSILDGKTSLIIGVNQALLEQIDAAELIRQANAVGDGQGGGGRKELAQAGGFDFNKIEAIKLYIETALNKL
jgi:alanyl-tRNA synthetase